MKKKWKPGDRVTRKAFMDDGTWAMQGDICLPNSPLRHGVVTRRSTNRNDEVFVEWDDGDIRPYLDHGLDAEKPGAKGLPFYLVMAKTYQDVDAWIREHKIQRHRAIFASSVMAVRGIRNVTLIKLPGYEEHHAYESVMEELPKIKGLIDGEDGMRPAAGRRDSSRNTPVDSSQPRA